MSSAAATGHSRRAFLGGAGMSVAAAVALTLVPCARAFALPVALSALPEGDWHVDDICGHMPRYAHPIPYMHDTSPPISPPWRRRWTVSSSYTQGES